MLRFGSFCSSIRLKRALLFFRSLREWNSSLLALDSKTLLVTLAKKPRASQQRTHGITRLSADAEPVIGSRFIDLYSTLTTVLARSVLTDDLDEFSVARALRVSDDDTIDRCFLPPDSAETNSYHLYISREGFVLQRAHRAAGDSGTHPLRPSAIGRQPSAEI
jgi:hypothetical protein